MRRNGMRIDAAWLKKNFHHHHLLFCKFQTDVIFYWFSLLCLQIMECFPFHEFQICWSSHQQQKWKEIRSEREYRSETTPPSTREFFSSLFSIFPFLSFLKSKPKQTIMLMMISLTIFGVGQSSQVGFAVVVSKSNKSNEEGAKIRDWKVSVNNLQVHIFVISQLASSFVELQIVFMDFWKKSIDHSHGNL